MRYAVSDRTKRELCNALKALMVQKPLEKITIREITESCGYTRQAFYHQFDDIYDLVNWMFQEDAKLLLKQQEGVLLWQEGLLQLMQYIQDNRDVCLCVLKSMGRNHLKRFFYTNISSIVHQSLLHIVKEQEFPEKAEELQLLTQMLVVSVAGIMESYLLEELDATPSQLLKLTDQMEQDILRGAALRLTDKKAANTEDASEQRKPGQ